jgi:hypothetical protein
MSKPCVAGRTFPQFDGHALAARNCGVSVTRSLVDFGSRGRIKPSAAGIRKRIGHDRWTTPGDVKKAVASYDDAMKRKGVKPLRYKRAGTLLAGLYTRGASREGLISRVRRLEMVHVVVDYGRVNDSRPALSGSPTFRDGHAIWIGGGTPSRPGFRYRSGKLEVRYSDPTWGRTGAPKATLRWVPFSGVWGIADGAWSSRGGRGWVGGSVACSPLLKTAPPGPTPEDPCEDVVAELEARLDATEEELAAAQDLLDELRTRIPDEELLERLRALRDDIDLLLGAIDDDTPVEQGMEVPE